MKKPKLSDKTIYRSIEFLHMHMKTDLLHEAYKLLWFDEIPAKTKAEKEVKYYIDAFKYLLTQTHEGITKDLIQRSYFLLTNSRISEKKIHEILQSFYGQRTNLAHVNASIIHQAVYRADLRKKLSFAHLLSNYALVSQGYSLFTLFPSEIIKYKEAISHIARDWTMLYGMIVANELHVRNNDKKILSTPLQATQEEVVKKVLSVKNKLTEEYQITSMYLYGSLTKDSAYGFSDIDCLVVMNDDKLAAFEKHQLLNRCKADLEDLLEARIDLIDIKTAIMQFGTNGIQQTIKIY